jgi:O-antigen ligase
VTLASGVAPFCSIAASQFLLGTSFAGLLLLRERLRFPPILLPLSLFFTGTVVSLLLSGHIAAGWPQIRKFYVFVLVLTCFATVVRNVPAWLTLVHGWGAAAAGSTLWGMVQFWQTIAVARRTGDTMYHALVGHRVTGFMTLWMTYAAQMMVAALVICALLMFSREGRRLWKWLAPCAVLASLGLVIALTRGPWIGGAAGAVYLLWQWNRKALLVLPVIAVLAFFAAPAVFRERAGSIVQPASELDSNQHRIVLWRTGFAMIQAHPWFGLGPEQVGKQFDRYVPADIPLPLPFGWYGHLHNVYLQYAAERGIPVLILFVWFIGKVFRDFFRALKRTPAGLDAPKALLHGSIAAMIAVLVAGCFEHNLGDSEVLQVFLTLIAAGYLAADVAGADS